MSIGDTTTLILGGCIVSFALGLVLARQGKRPSSTKQAPTNGKPSPPVSSSSPSDSPSVTQDVLRPGQSSELWLDVNLRSWLSPPDYVVLHNVIVPSDSPRGLAQIDNLVVSKHGVFVIETKSWNATVYGSDRETDTHWTVFRPGKSKEFLPNPILQNRMHVETLAKCLDLPISHFRSIVAFAPWVKFATDLPGYVMGTEAVHGYITRHACGSFPLLSDTSLVVWKIRHAEQSVPADKRAEFERLGEE